MKLKSAYTILVVDDSEAILNLLKEILEENRYQVLTAQNGNEALDILKKRNISNNGAHKVDLMLLDIALPQKNGFEVLKEIQDEKGLKGLPVIVVTAYYEPSDIIKGLDSGASDYIPKPINTEVLLARIRNQRRLQSLKEELKTHNTKLKALDKLRNEFIGMAAHDLRSPLSTIKMYSEFLLSHKKENLDATQKDFLEIILRTSSHTLELLNDLLDATLIESGQLNLNKKKQSINQFLKEVYLHQQLIASQKDIKLVLLLPDNDILIDFDSERLMQVMNNLLSNAFKFSYPDTTVKILLDRKDTHIIVYVIDQGLGIPEDEYHVLFKEFQRTSVKPTGNEGSTGLGLPIVKKIVNLHHGTVYVESKVGKGSIFSFTIPFES